MMKNKAANENFDMVESFVRLVEVSLGADFTEVRRIGNALSRYLESSGDLEKAHRVRSLLRRKATPLRASGHLETLPVDTKSRMPLIEELPWPETPIFLSESSNETFRRFIEEVENTEKLSKEGLAMRPCLILSGPPGTGKTLFASHVASRLNRPLYVVRLDSVISSFLGETAKNIRSAFEFLSSKEAVLLLDELDAIAKMRDDRQELGELKRVVNTLIQGLDSLDDRSIIIGATNHPQLLDLAIWRRFPYKVTLDLPDESIRATLWEYFLYQGKEESRTVNILGLASAGFSGADIREIAFSERRRSLLKKEQIDVSAVIWSIAELRSGRSALPPNNGLTSHQKRSVARFLFNEIHVKQAEIARLLGTSRQTISNYIRDKEHDS
jgi:SpoVK/Ycf46/Vps4 family AAA+-type ATPase